MAKKTVSSTVDQELFEQAQGISGEGQAATIRLALRHYVDHALFEVEAPSAISLGASPVLEAADLPVDQMSEEQRRASLTLLVRARQALGDAVVHLTGEEVIADAAEKSRLRILIADLEAELTKVNARITAFQAGRLAMVPPSADTVEEIGQLAEQVGELIVEAQRTDRIMTVVQQVIEIWSGTQV
ncbi:MAG: hypothetical protein AAGD01_10745 [Acidobacteriota bacterium]